MLEGQSKTGEILEKRYREQGKGSGLTFGEAFNQAVTKDLDDTARKVAGVFKDDGGIEAYRKSLGSVGDGYEGINHTVDELSGKLHELKENQRITSNEFSSAQASLKRYGAEAVKAEDGVQRIAGATENLKNALHGDLIEHLGAMDDEFDRSWQSAKKANEEYDSSSSALKRLTAALPDNDKTHEAEAALGRLSHAFNIDEIDKAHGAALKLGDGLEDLGKKAEGSEGKTKGLSKAMSSLRQSFTGFDPTDNPLQLFAIILGFAGPLAGLVSALAAQIVVLGTAAVAGGIGVGLLAAAFQGMFGDISKLPASVRPAAAALQGLKKPLQDAQDLLQEHVFKGLADDIGKIGTSALPALSGGIAKMGDALNGFLGKAASGITSNAGAINDLLGGFAPIVTNIGNALLSVTGAVGGLLKAATPFATELTGDIAAAAGKFSDFVNSTKGQNALAKWFQDAQDVMSHVGGVISAAGKAFESLITPTTLSNLDGMLDDISSLLTDLGKIGGALSPAAGAFSSLVSEIGNILTALDPVLEGVGNFASGVIAVIKPVIDFILTTFAPVFQVIGAALDILGAAFTAFGGLLTQVFGGAEKATQPLRDALGKYLTDSVNTAKAVIKGLQPVIDAIGGVFKAAGSAVGELVGGFIGAGKASDTFKGAAGTVKDFLAGPFADGVQTAAGHIKDFTAYITNNVIPSIKEIDWTQVSKGIDAIGAAVPEAVGALGDIIQAVGLVIGVIGDLVKAAQSGMGAVGTALTGAAKVFDDVAHGRFAAAAVDGAKAFVDTAKAAQKFQTDSSKALTDVGKAYDGLAADGRAFAGHVHDIMDDGKKAIADFQKAGDGNLAGVSKSLGLTGDKSTEFRSLIAGNAKGAGVSLKTLADDKSLSQIETDLGITGTASKTKFANQIIDAMNLSKDSIGSVPKPIQDLINKYGDLPKSKNTDVKQTGAQGAGSEVDTLKGKINALTGKTVTVSQTGAGPAYNDVINLRGAISSLSDKTVTILTKQITSGTAHGAVGGMFVGGTLFNDRGVTARAFASGGITNGSTYLNSSTLVGEAGPEAIVPLSGALSSVDRSVRALSAYARGRVVDPTQNSAAETGKRLNVAAGAIQVISSSTDGRQVASSVLDRLSAVVGG